MEDRDIINVLKKNYNPGLSITEIVGLSNLSRSAVRISLARLEGSGKVFVRKVGMAKLYYLQTKNGNHKRQ